MRRSLRQILLIGFTLCISTALVAQDTCQVQMQSMMDFVNSYCMNSERNQVCYGNVRVQALPQPGVLELNFDKPGDQEPVSLVKSLQLSPMNLSQGTWGIARMRLIPTTARSAEDDVILLLFGDVKIEDRSEPRSTFDFTITAAYNINLRNFPSLDSTVIGWLEPGTQVTALGRLEDGSWLRVQKQPAGSVGWVSADVLQADDLSQVNTLKIEGIDDPYFGPMQAISLDQGSTSPDCDGVIPDGLLVQTPEGVARVTLLINEVTIDFISTGAGATAYIRAQPDGTMSVSMLEGSAYISTDTQTMFVPPGAQLTIPVDGSGNPDLSQVRPVASDPNSVNALYSGLDRQPDPVIWSPPVVQPDEAPANNPEVATIPLHTSTAADGSTVVVLNDPVLQTHPAVNNNPGDGSGGGGAGGGSGGSGDSGTGGGSQVSGGGSGGGSGGQGGGGGEGDSGGGGEGGSGSGTGGDSGGGGSGGGVGGLLCGLLGLLGGCN